MKITSGWCRGMAIQSPQGLDTRPTRERVRQSAVNMLQPWIAGGTVLDLFAGSGAVGIEFVSRGAAGAVFVDIDREAEVCLRTNMEAAKKRAKQENIALTPWILIADDVFTYVNSGVKSAQEQSFDLIWADPPYELVPEFLDRSLHSIMSRLNPQGLFALEYREQDRLRVTSRVALRSTHKPLTEIKHRRYGVTAITIWQKQA